MHTLILILVPVLDLQRDVLPVLLDCPSNLQKQSELASDKKVTPAAGGKELLFVQTEFMYYPTPAGVFACQKALRIVKDAWKNEPGWLNTEERQAALKYIDLQLYEHMHEDTHCVDLPKSVGRITRVEYL